MINWKKAPNFKAKDFPEDPDLYSDPEILYALQSYRTKINNPIIPSPVPGALARFEGNTQSCHYVDTALNPIKKSSAVDIFVEGIPLNNLLVLMTTPEIRGIGVYLHTTGPDGKPWVMFHIDTRARGYTDKLPLVWVCEKAWKPVLQKRINVYRYPQTLPAYWTLLQNESMYLDKRFGKDRIEPATIAGQNHND